MAKRDPYSNSNFDRAARVPDYSNPASALEAAEEEAELQRGEELRERLIEQANIALQAEMMANFQAAFGRMLAWICDAKKISAIGQRAMIAGYVVRPDLVDSATLDVIAKKRGQGRSSTHKLKKDFQGITGLKCLSDKPEDAIKHYKKAWRESPYHQPVSKK